MTDARARGERGSLEARFSGVALAWDTVEAAEQDRSTELTSRNEANGTVTTAGDAIALDLVCEVVRGALGRRTEYGSRLGSGGRARTFGSHG